MSQLRALRIKIWMMNRFGCDLPESRYDLFGADGLLLDELCMDDASVGTRLYILPQVVPGA